MADVLIVCVREDEPQAKALADMFEAAGFTIGGAPGSDAALRSSGAGVIVWSQASIRSRPFLDAAQRVINADKAVVASLIEPPPPSSVGDAPAFDLSRWNGDPDDPSLDPLFFAVDRMVNAARASVGAPSASIAEEPRLEPRRNVPPPRIERIESTRPAPRPAPPPPLPAAKPDALETETEYWRAIRDSKNPADFMDYIARYGPQGAFAEVAEIKLKQLTNAANAAPVAPPAPQTRPAARPITPPRAEAPPPRRADPPPRRAESPLPPTRRAEMPLPPRRPTYDRGYDRNDAQEPQRSEGGGAALRTFVLIALLGGAALAGLYFGGVGQQPAEQREQVAANTTPQEPASYEDGAAQSDAGSVPLSDAVVQRPTQSAEARPTPQRPEPARTETRREPERTRPERETEQPTPAPTNNWSASSSGPVSLRPGDQASNTTASPPVSLNPPAPSTTAPSVAATAPATTQNVAAPPPGTVRFTARPSARRIAELYPQRAARQGVGGRVALDCSVRADLSMACAVASETPAGEGFGRAALAAAGAYRADARLSNGQTATGARTRINVNFQAPSE